MAKHTYVERTERRIGLGDIWRSGLNLIWVGTESINQGAETVYRASCVMDTANQCWYEKKVAEYEAEHEAALKALDQLDETPEPSGSAGGTPKVSSVK